MELVVRDAQREDVPFIMQLIKELAIYEKSENEVETTITSMLEDGFGERPCFNAMVAELHSEIVGIAVYFYSYSTWKGRSLYLDDLVVSEKVRRMGVGHQLFGALVKKAASEGVGKMHWQVLDWNEPAIHFYEKWKATLQDGWLNVSLSKQQLNEYGQR